MNRYQSKQPCAHLIGHLDESGKGATGLERVYDNFLSMQSGGLKAVWSVDALGHILYGNGISFKSDNYNSPAGLQLTIDLEIQKIAENALESFNINKGAVVVTDAETSEILASASLPVFNPNDLAASVSDEAAPFLNRAAVPYSVGSVFKPIVAACAFENNVSVSHICTGGIKIGGTVFGCNDSTAHGEVDLKKAMERSCNTYFIALGQKAGADKLLSLCSAMGFGKSEELADNYYLKPGISPPRQKFPRRRTLQTRCSVRVSLWQALYKWRSHIPALQTAAFTARLH